jgi:hypothetical protein
MSLPSRAFYFKKVHDEFVNCGWFLSPESLLRCILELPPCPCEFEFVKLYGIDIPKKFIQFKENFSSLSEFEEAFKEFMKDKGF